MRSSLVLLLVAAGTLCLAASPDVGSGAPSSVNAQPPPPNAFPPSEDLSGVEHDVTGIADDTLNTTDRKASVIKNPAFLRYNPKVLVRIIYAVDDHGGLYINHGTSSPRSTRERIRLIQRPRYYKRVYRWQGWLHSGSVIGWRAINKAGAGGLIFSIYLRVGRRWILHNSGQYPLRLHTFSARSRYLGWMKVNYRPCRWKKALGPYVHDLKIARKFPYKSKAKYVWLLHRRGERTVHHRGHMIFRYKLGGECGFRPAGVPPPRPVVRRNFRFVTIQFASDNTGYLFINGRRVRVVRDVRSAASWKGWLRVGTTVGFQTTNSKGPGGIIASILIRHGKRHYRLNTGRYPFRVHGISRNRKFNHIWKFPAYKTCRWPRATKPFVHNLRISKKFKYSTGAKYIWFPKSVNRRGTMFMRYRIGGERCNPRPRRNFRFITIIFACDNIGYLYINGRVRRVIRNAKKSAHWRGWVRLGSTIGIQARNNAGAGGIIASMLVQHGRRKFRLNTGSYPFRVHLYWKNARLRRLNQVWKFPAYKTCSWPRARGPWVHNLRISRTFPYRRLKAKYIWAPGNRNHIGTIFLRYRLGGERCRRPPVPPRPGRGCPCRKSTNPNRGDCYYFIGKEPTGSKPGFCKKKNCEIKYECTSRARAKGRCIWKFATDEVRSISSSGRLTCRRFKLGKRTPFLVPYTG